MKRFITIIGLCAIFTLTIASTGLSALGNTKTLEGTVANIENNIVTIMQQSSDQLKIAVQIQADDKTQYKKVASLEQLKEGDQVEVSYKEENGHKIATSIVRVEPTDKKS